MAGFELHSINECTPQITPESSSISVQMIKLIEPQYLNYEFYFCKSMDEASKLKWLARTKNMGSYVKFE